MYESVPRNESNCVVEGTGIILNYYVSNPHDNFTNLTVRWFRNNNVERPQTSTLEITDLQNRFELHRGELSVEGINADNCSYGLLYRDPFLLIIYNFTSDKNGYYWCQIYVNNSVSQPSQYAWFYAADSSSCTQQHHFKLTSEPQCADFHPDTDQVSVVTPQETLETVMLTSTLETLEATSTSGTLETTSTSAKSKATSTFGTLETIATSTFATLETTSTSATLEMISTSATIEAISTLETTSTSGTLQTISTSRTVETTSSSVTIETTSTSATSGSTSTIQKETDSEFTSTGTMLKYNIVSATEAESSVNYLFYIIGFLVALILLAISLFTLILLLLYCKGRKKDCQRSGKYATITVLAAIVQSSN